MNGRLGLSRENGKKGAENVTSSQHSLRVRLEVEPSDGSTSNLARCLEVVVPPEVGEGLLGFKILDTIKNLLLGGVGIPFEIPTSLKRNG